MYELIIPTVAGVACVASWGFALHTKKRAKRMDEIRSEMQHHAKFFEWAMGTRIVVRDKVAHKDVSDLTLYALYQRFQHGQAFRHATLLFDNNEFKVYAQEKGE